MAELSDQQMGWIQDSKRQDINGWIYLRVGGEPFARGFQIGYNTVNEFKQAVETYSALTYLTIGMDYSFFVDNAVKMHKDKIPEELLEEMEGMAAGFTAGGYKTTVEDIIGWNAWEELTGYWWPTVQKTYAKDAPTGKAPTTHCSGFVATGSYSKDGKPVIGHTSFDYFAYGQYFNLLLDMTPAKGHRMVMQSVPGYIGSFTDYWVMDSGIAVTETTMGGFNGYDPDKTPEYVRARNACQYANNIDEWVQIIRKDDNGGYANTWLLADVNTGEIARYEEGLIYTNLEKTTDGFYYGDNGPQDPRIRNLECSPVGYEDVRQQVGARRVRWRQLLEGNKGQITAELGKRFLADGYDPYLGYVFPDLRTICCHCDSDPGSCGGPAPFSPFGSCDGKVAQADDIKAVRFWGRFGRADGYPFYAADYNAQHPEWDIFAPYLIDRPSQPWTLFDNGTVTTQTTI